MTLLLTREAIQPLLSLSKAIELTEEAFKQQALGEVTAHAPYHIAIGGRNALRVVSGALLGTRRAGIRLGPNSELGGDRMHALLYDTESGDLLSVMGYPFGTLRTAATVALAAKSMAREDAKQVGLFGVGRNALGMLQGICLVRGIERITVFSRDAQRRKTFSEKAEESLHVNVRPVEAAREAVEGMDIVLTATNSQSPVFSSDWIRPGTHISSMGKPSELGRELFLKADRIVVGSREHEQNYFDRSVPAPLVELADEGRLPWDKIPELGHVVCGRASGRKSSDEVTVFKESQGGFGDVAFAAWLYGEALRRGLGREAEL